MLNLAATNTLLSLITSAAGSIDVVPSWMDLSGTTVTPGGTPLSITTAGTTTIVPAPAASTVRNVKSVNIRNKGAASNTVTVQVSVGGTLYEVRKVTLAPGQSLMYDDSGLPWQVVSEATNLRSVSNADQALAASTLTLVNNSVLDATNLKAGTVFKWQLVMSKTAAGTAAQTFSPRFGTAGSTADTERIAGLTTGTQTAAADVAEVDVTLVVRSVGASGVVHGKMELSHNLAATGFAPTSTVVQQVVSAGFDMTVANLKASLSTTAGASSVTTIHQCIAERIEP